MSNLLDISEKLGELEEELSTLKSATEQIGKARDAATETIEATERMSSLLGEVVEGNNELVKQGKEVFAEIQAVDFPKRLEKIDNSITAISVGTQNLLTASQSIDAKIEKFGKLVDEKLDGVNKSINAKIEESSVLISRGGNLRKKLLIAIIVIQIIIVGSIFFAIPWLSKLSEQIKYFEKSP